MGHLDQPLNTFWQLFFRPNGSSRWTDEAASLAVATNGGLVMATPDGRSLTVGIRPANLLSFSPLLVTPKTGSSWSSAAPVPALADHPDALAFGVEGRALALSASGKGGEVLASSVGLASWSKVTTAAALGSSPAGRACGLVSMTAVGVAAARYVIGAACRRAGVVGLLTGPQGGWHLAGPTLPASLDHGSVTVLGLQRTSGGLCALLAVYGEQGTSLVAAWATGGTTSWRVSPVLAIGAGQVLSIGPNGPMGLFVLASHSAASDSVEVLNGPGTAWRSLAAPPAHTSTLVFGSAGKVDALVVDDTVFTDWALARGSGRWVSTQIINVPIEFGSSG
jgi:hypothetical protein